MLKSTIQEFIDNIHRCAQWLVNEFPRKNLLAAVAVSACLMVLAVSSTDKQTSVITITETVPLTLKKLDAAPIDTEVDLI